MTNILLSICIPTYNRETYLKRLLESIVSQGYFSGKVEVVINDGPSQDNTQRLVKEYQKKYKNIRYYRNDKAIGMTPAIMESISYSQGKYTWIFSSDDVMGKQALQHVLSLVETHNPTLIIHNRLVFYKESEYHRLGNSDLKYNLFNGFNSFTDFLGSDIKNTLIEKMDYFTFMSIACFNTEHYKHSLEKILHKSTISTDDLQRHYFNRALIIYSNLRLNNNQKIALINNKDVYAQAGNAGWTKNQKIIDDLIILFNSLSEQYNIHGEGNVFFEKTVSYWKFSFNFLHPLLNNKFVYFIKSNKITKYIYNQVASLVNFFLKRLV